MRSVALNQQMSQQVPAVAAQRRSAAASGAFAGPIAQLAGEIDSSPRVRSLAQLRQSIHQSPRVQTQLRFGADSVLPQSDRSFDPPQSASTLTADSSAASSHACGCDAEGKAPKPVQAKAKEEKLQAKSKEEKIQGKAKDELHQRRAEDAASTSGGTEAATSSGSGLPPQLKNGVESLSGMSMDHVQVHYNSAKPAQLNALAYAQGSDIHVGPGQEQHLPHEAWHVVQQAQGRVQTTKQLKAGIAINDDKGLEHEADVMGAKALRSSGSTLQRMLAQVAPGRPVVQMRMPTVAALETIAPKGSVVQVISKTKTYEDVLDSVERFYDAGQTPANDYGIKLYRLHQISQAVQAWVAKYGATNLAIANNIFGSETDLSKRRRAVHSVSTEVDPEETLAKNTGYYLAKAKHDQDRKNLAHYVYEGASGNDRRLKNSCEWILRGKVPLFAVTQTGDAYMRVRSRGEDPNLKTALFPHGSKGFPGDMMNDTVYYDRDNYNDNNVRLDTRTTGGWNVAGEVIAVVISAKTKEQVWTTLRHEVQHDADKNRGRDAQSGVRKGYEQVDAAGGSDQQKLALQKSKAERDLQRYKTEYRAYSYQEGDTPGIFSALDDKLAIQNYQGRLFTARQLAIFKHIYDGYEHTKDNWDADSALPDGRTFRDAVVSYRNPDEEGFNKWNSIRVDAFYAALDAVGTKRPATQVESVLGIDISPVTPLDLNKLPPKTKIPPSLITLQDAAEQLTKEDGEYILNGSPALRAKLERHLSKDLIGYIESLVELKNAKVDLDALLKKLNDLNK